MTDNAVVFEGSEISGNAFVGGNASVSDVKVNCNARVSGNAFLEKAEITDNVVVCDHGRVEYGAYVYGNVIIRDCGTIPCCVGIGGAKVVTEWDDRELSCLYFEMRYIEDLQGIIQQWVMEENPPYGFEDDKEYLENPTKFRQAVENFIFGDRKKFYDAIIAYEVAVGYDPKCDGIDADRYHIKPEKIEEFEEVDESEEFVDLVFDPKALSASEYVEKYLWYPKAKKDLVIDSEVALSVVQSNGMLLRYVKEQTPEVCLAAVKQCVYALKWVKDKTPEICNTANEILWSRG